MEVAGLGVIKMSVSGTICLVYLILCTTGKTSNDNAILEFRQFGGIEKKNIGKQIAVEELFARVSRLR